LYDKVFPVHVVLVDIVDIISCFFIKLVVFVV